MVRMTIAAAASGLVLTLGAVLPVRADELPFVGRWDCEVGVFTFTPTTYDTGSETLDILEAQEGSDGSYTLVFDGDYTIALSGFTEETMGWFSPASGDAFTCTRLADEN